MTQEESEKKWFRTICYEKNWDDTESRIWTIFDINEIRKRDWYQEEFIKAAKGSWANGSDYAKEGAINVLDCWDEPSLLPLVENIKLSDVHLDNYLNKCKDRWGRTLNG